jgi:hypothetical protein
MHGLFEPCIEQKSGYEQKKQKATSNYQQGRKNDKLILNDNDVTHLLLLNFPTAATRGNSKITKSSERLTVRLYTNLFVHPSPENGYGKNGADRSPQVALY